MPRMFIVLLMVSLLGCGFFGGDDKMNLIIACKDGNVERVNYFLEKVRTPNFISLKGDTPLNTAIYNNHLNIVKILLDSGASCSLKDELGETPLLVAQKVGDSSILEYLESHGRCK